MGHMAPAPWGCCEAVSVKGPRVPCGWAWPWGRARSPHSCTMWCDIHSLSRILLRQPQAHGVEPIAHEFRSSLTTDHVEAQASKSPVCPLLATAHPGTGGKAEGGSCQSGWCQRRQLPATDLPEPHRICPSPQQGPHSRDTGPGFISLGLEGIRTPVLRVPSLLPLVQSRPCRVPGAVAPPASWACHGLQPPLFLHCAQSAP